MSDIDFDAYGEPNDIGPDDPAPREPAGEPDQITDEFRVWLFDADHSETVPEVYVVDRDPKPLAFRMWVFLGRGQQAHFVMRASHKYSEGELVPGGREDCCEVLFEGQSLGPQHCPDAVEAFVADLTGADVVTAGPPDTGTDGPINY